MKRFLLAGASLLALYIAYKWFQRARFYSLLRMARIGVDELYELMQAGAAPVVIDVRSATARSLEPRWIPGALNISLSEVGQRLKDLPRDRDIIVYCTCPSEETSAKLALQLHKMGVYRVRPLRGGFDGWKEAGYPLVDYVSETPSSEVVQKILPANSNTAVPSM